MHIIEIKALRGPNYWSNYRKKIIVMKLDIGEYEKKPTNKIPGFLKRLQELIPSIHSHRCSYDFKGGFLKRVEEGTWAGHVVEHIALEIQTLAGMSTGYGRTRETKQKGIYNVVFSYIEEKAGIYTAEAALNLFLGLAEDKDIKELQSELAAHIQKLREIREEVRFGPSTDSIIEEARLRDIPHLRLNDQSLVQLGYGIYQQRIQATVTCKTNNIAVEIAGDKSATKKLLGSMGIPVPEGIKIRSIEELEPALEKIGFPLAIKPLDSNHGKGITVNVTSLDEAKTAFDAAKRHSSSIIVERSLAGKDFRALVIDNRLVSVAERKPALVTGDGKSTIQQLIDIENKDKRRGYGHEKILTQITVDHQTRRLLDFKGYTLETILKEDEIFYLKATANLSTGGTAVDRTDEVHPYNIFLFERIARIIGLDIAGIDIIAPDLMQPINENGGGIVEVNAAPGFRMHLAPSEGIGKNVAEHVVNMLFPRGVPFRIPIIAVTGTNGKTTTTRLIAHIMKNVGYNVGFTTTDGVYIGNRLIQAGDNTGPVSAQMVLRDPTVELAVLETARGGILRAGLGFDKCNIGIVMNVTADHIGLKDIDTVEDMADVKSVVARSVVRNGYAVLNADDELVFKMREELDCKIALFSMQENNKVIKEHTKNGGIACIYENSYITLLNGPWKIRVEKVINIPLTYSGRAAFMIQNVLAATLASYILHGVKTEDIRFGLSTFAPSSSQIPGRLNFIELENFSVLIDYAHNPAGLEALGKFIEKFSDSRKTGIISGTGDRRNKDIKNFGKTAAAIFDNIIIKEDDSLRGRKDGEIPELLIEGIQSVNGEIPVKVIVDETEAIEYALSKAKKNELLVILPDNIPKAIDLVTKYKEEKHPVEFEKSDIPNL